MKFGVGDRLRGGRNKKSELKGGKGGRGHEHLRVVFARGESGPHGPSENDQTHHFEGVDVRGEREAANSD